MKKSLYILPLLPLWLSIATAQMPTSFDASGNSAQAQSGTQPASNGEPANPRLMGMEIPLLDPSSDTVSYNGSKFDVGNNALVRDRFEKYLNQPLDDSAEARRYMERIEEILKITRRAGSKRAEVGSKVLVKVGMGLYELDEYPGDDGQAAALASAMVSVLDSQRAARRRDAKNAQLDAEIDKLVGQSNDYRNKNAERARKERAENRKESINMARNNRGANLPGANADEQKYNQELVDNNRERVKEHRGERVKNKLANEAAEVTSKIQFQTMLMGFLMQRRFDHALIGTRVYRHLFADGDTKVTLDSNSDASKLLKEVCGTEPTIGVLDSVAAGARKDVDQHIAAVHSMMAQGRMADATQHLIQAVAVGEYMQSVKTFPQDARLRIARYWNLRKRSLAALNARDYGTLEELADEMKEMDADFDDSMLRSYCEGRKMQSDLCLRNAMKALQAGNEEEFNKHIAEAGAIWPRNPKLKEGAEQLQKLDSQDPVKDEFRQLMQAKEYRRVYDNQARYEAVAIDPELREEYKKVIELVGTIDGMLKQLGSLAAHDKVMGPCMAYEKLLAYQKEDERVEADDAFRDALHSYAVKAHDFVQALTQASECESRGEYGSALSCYYRAQCLYPSSDLAKEGAERVTEVILKASF